MQQPFHSCHPLAIGAPAPNYLWRPPYPCQTVETPSARKQIHSQPARAWPQKTRPPCGGQWLAASSSSSGSGLLGIRRRIAGQAREHQEIARLVSAGGKRAAGLLVESRRRAAPVAHADYRPMPPLAAGTDHRCSRPSRPPPGTLPRPSRARGRPAPDQNPAPRCDCAVKPPQAYGAGQAAKFIINDGQAQRCVGRLGTTCLYHRRQVRRRAHLPALICHHLGRTQIFVPVRDVQYFDWPQAKTLLPKNGGFITFITSTRIRPPAVSAAQSVNGWSLYSF